MRKSIFDIVASELDMESDTRRLIQMSSNEATLYRARTGYTIFEFVDEFCFKEWEYRSRYMNVDDFLMALNYQELIKDATWNMESHLTLIELIYNFWNLANNKFSDMYFKDILRWDGNFYHIKDVMDDILEECNHIVYGNEESDYFIVVENKPEVTAVSEIMPTVSLAFDVIKYNHRSMQGDIDTKRKILLSLGAELEPQRRRLESISKKLDKNIFFMLNNLNIRHNNCSVDDPAKYKEYVANMDDDRMEEWYDELYQMILLAFLALDNEERSAKVKELQEKISGGK